MDEQQEAITVELAKTLMDEMELNFPKWQHAFIRFDASDGYHGSKGSYVTPEGIFLLDPFKQRELFQKINFLGHELRNMLTHNGKKFCVFLLHVNSSFDFKVDYEWKDTNKWQISKIGGTGVPIGIEL